MPYKNNNFIITKIDFIQSITRFHLLRKYFVLMFFLTIITTSANAQLSIGGSVGTNISGISFLGISIPEPAFDFTSSYQLSKRIDVGINIGMYPFFNQFVDYSWFIIPFQIMGGYLINDTRNNFQPFIKVACGLYSNIDDDSAITNVGIAPQLGFNYLITKKMQMVGGLKYNIIIPNNEKESFRFWGCSLGLSYKIFTNTKR